MRIVVFVIEETVAPGAEATERFGRAYRCRLRADIRARDVIDDDGAGGQFDAPKSKDLVTEGFEHVPDRGVAAVSTEDWPRTGEGVEQALSLLVRESAHDLGSERGERGWEVLGEDSSAFIENDAKRLPIGSGHLGSGSFVDSLSSPVDRFRKCPRPRPVSIADIGGSGLRETRSCLGQALRAPTQSLGDLLQRFDLHVAHVSPASDSRLPGDAHPGHSDAHTPAPLP